MPSAPHPHRAITLALLGLLACGCLLTFLGPASNLDRDWWDFLSRRTADASRLPDPDAVLLLIDEPAVREVADTYGERWPWKRSTFAGLLAAIHEAGAGRILVDLALVDPSEDGTEDAVFAVYAAAIPDVVLAELPGRPSIVHGELPAETRVLTGRVGYVPDEDGVIRRYHYRNSLIAPLAGSSPPEEFRVRWYGGIRSLPADKVRGAASLVVEGKRLLDAVRQSGADEMDPASVRQALDNLPRSQLTGLLAGRTVFLGASHAGGFDVKDFPVSALEPGVLLHYTAWQNAVGYDWMREPLPAGGWSALLLGWFLGGVILLAGWREIGGHSLRGISITLLLAWLAVATFAFTRNLVLPVAWPAIAVVLAYLTAASRHWWLQHRQRREVEGYFGSYVAPAVLSELRNGAGPRLGGERREVTLFFSDMAGFTTLSESVSPEVLVDIVNRCLSTQTGPILTEGGYLDKYIGDAVMGVFGAPQPLPNHALAACRAAVACREALSLLALELKNEHAVDIAVRIGLNTGTAVVGNVGSERKLNYTALGDPVNLAARLEGANKVYGTSILAGESTVAAAGPAVLSRPVDILQVKGKTRGIPVHEILGLAGKAPSETIDRAARHASAFRQYLSRDFAGALEAFGELSREMPADPLPRLMHGRCHAFLDHPPPSDWNGVTVLKDK